MRRLTPLSAILCAVLAAGCSSGPGPRPEPPQDAAPASSTAPSATEVAPTAAPPQADAPAATPREFDAELLYELLVAEFAGQRGALKTSTQYYLDAAYKLRNAEVARRAVHVAVFSRDYERALDAALLWVDLAPQDLEARQSLAALLLRQGELLLAAEQLERVVLGLGDNARAFGLLANLLARERNADNALSVMQRLVEPRREDPAALYALAQLASSHGRDEAALETLDRLLIQEPELVKALVLKADVLHRMGEKEGAVGSIEAAVELEPDNNDLRLTYARLLVEARRLEQARKEFRKLNKARPDSPDVLFALGLLAMQAEELDAAEQYFDQLLRTDAHRDEAAYALGQIAEAREDFDQAVQWYESVGQGGNFIDARLRVAHIIAERQGLDAARGYLQSLELTEPSQRLRRYLAEGALLREADRHRDAMEVYSDGLAVFIGNTELLYARAMAAEHIDRIDLLEQDLHEVLKHDPENTQALNALGYTLADRTERLQEAKTYIDRAFEQAPDDPAVIDSMGWVLYRLGEHEQALEHLRHALSLQRDGEIAAHLGEVLWVTGRHNQAREVWNQALEYAPEHEILLRAVRRFTGQ